MGDANAARWERSDSLARARALVQAAQARSPNGSEREARERCHALGGLSRLLLSNPPPYSTVQACSRELWVPLQSLCNDRLLAVSQAAAVACGIVAALVSQSIPAPSGDGSQSTPSRLGSPTLDSQPTGWGDPPNHPTSFRGGRGRSSPRGLLKRGARTPSPLHDPERREERRWLARFFTWARSLLSEGLQGAAVNGRSAAALVALHEAFARGSSSVLQDEAKKMLVAVQALLEDEETPLGLLSPLVHLVTALGKNFPGAFSGHQFVDLVDVLLGWALDPTLPQALHHQLSQGTFLQFHASLWGDNYQFAINLLSKLVGDLDRLTAPEKEKTGAGSANEEPSGKLSSAKDATDVSSSECRESLSSKGSDTKPLAPKEKPKHEEDSQPEADSEGLEGNSVALTEASTPDSEDKADVTEAKKKAPEGLASDKERPNASSSSTTDVLRAGSSPQTVAIEQQEEPALAEKAAESSQSQLEEGTEREGLGSDAAKRTGISDAIADLKLSEGVQVLQAEEASKKHAPLDPKSSALKQSTSEERGTHKSEEQTVEAQTIQLTSEQAGHLLCLLRCFEAVLEALASALLTSGRPKTLQPFAKQWLPRFLGCAQRVGAQLQDATWTRECCRCLAVFAGLLKEGFAPSYADALKYLLEMADHASDAAQVAAILQVNLQLLASQKAALAPPTVTLLLSSPIILRFRVNSDQAVVNAVVNTLVFLLQHESTAVVHSAIAELEPEMRSGVETLSSGDRGNSKHFKGINAEGVLAVLKQDVGLLLTFALNDLSQQRSVALGSKQHPKTATEGAEQLSWGDATLQGEASMKISTDLKQQEKSSAQRVVHMLVAAFTGSELCPELREALFDALQAMSQAALGATPNLQGLFASQLCSLALSPRSSYGLKLKALDWTEKILLQKSPLQDKLSTCPAFKDNVLSTLLTAARDPEADVRERSASILLGGSRARSWRAAQNKQVAEAAAKLRGDISVHAAETARALILETGLALEYSTPVEGTPALHQLAIAPQTRSFRPQQLAFLLQHLGQIQHQTDPPLADDWLQRLIHSLSHVPSPVHEHQNPLHLEGDSLSSDWLEQASISHVSAQHLLVHEAARHCVSSKLRTHFGGPTQTFAAIEQLLKTAVTQLLADGVEQGHFRLEPIHFLLEFVDALERLVWGATHGSGILPPIAEEVGTFFAANRKVVDEWFARFRGLLLQTTTALQEHDGAAWHASLRLEGLRNAARALASQVDRQGGEVWSRLQKDVTSAVRQLALAFREAEDPDVILGLRTWVKQAFPSQMWLEGKAKEDSTPTNVEGPSSSFAYLEALQLEASGQYEAAAGAYSHLLDPESANSLTLESARFVVERACASYAAVTDWQGLQAWLTKVQSLRAANGSASRVSLAGLDLNPILALSRFDEGDVQVAQTYLDRLPESRNRVTLNPGMALQRSAQMLLQAMLEDTEKATEDLAAARELLEDPMYAAATVGSLKSLGPHLVQAECLKIVEGALKQSSQSEKSEAQLLLTAVNEDGGKTFDLPEWLKLLRIRRFASKLKNKSLSQSSPAGSEVKALHLQVVRSARKQGNLHLAQRLLKQGPLLASSPAADSLEVERALVVHDLGSQKEAASLVSEFLKVEGQGERDASNEKVVAARAYLKLAKWVQTPETAEMVSKDLDSLQEGHPQQLQKRLFARAAQLAPRFGKAWYNQAVWYDSHVPPGDSLRVKLTEREQDRLLEVLSETTDSQAETGAEKGAGSVNLPEKVVRVLEGPRNDPAAAEATPKDPLRSAGQKGRPKSAGREEGRSVASSIQSSLEAERKVRDSLGEIFSAEGFPFKDSQLTEIVKVWRGAKARALENVSEAIRGYSRFLSLSLEGAAKGNRVLHSLVRLLQLLSEHGAVLHSAISEAFDLVPVYTWQALLPQIFALLRAHPQSEVRGVALRVLQRLGREFPLAILYPVLAGCAEEEVPSELVTLRGTLMEVAPEAVLDTERMLGSEGLQRLILLWSEEWLQLLTDLGQDVTKRLTTLSREVQRVAVNANLTPADRARINTSKFTALMTPVAVLLERKIASASAKTDTPFDRQFQERYAAKLKAALTCLRTAPEALVRDDVIVTTDVASLKSACWEPFTAIAQQLAADLQRHTLRLADLSPALASLSGSHVPLPGYESRSPSLIPTSPVARIDLSAGSFFAQETLDLLDPAHDWTVTIERMHADVAQLSTKTRPKRVGMIGSDGQLYHFLLKGREDLRLDARIMQVLRACNTFLESHRSSQQRDLGNRQYSITPISPRAGLIQWVPALQSIYASYKSWQQRQFAMQLRAGLTDAAHPPRPSDLYYAKVMAGLKEKGLRGITSRKEWPQDVKRKALIELMKDTPRQLLAKEIWIASTGAADAFWRQQRYSRTAAVMSMVGHVLGLGDRHLDNILLDFSTAEVVHIDHNVAFDKGLRLRVPEVVPFRLTPIMQQALGLLGVEGTFRVACEETLAALRKNESSLLGLLDVFTWEPLAEWTAGRSEAEGAALGREERQGMEIAVSLSLLASKVQEQQHAMQEHRDFLASSIPKFHTQLSSFLAALASFRDATTAVQVHQESAQKLAGQGVLIELQLGSAKAAAQNAESALVGSLQKVEALRKGVEVAAQESKQWWQQHEVAVQGLKGSGPAKEQISVLLSAASQSSQPRALTLLESLESIGLNGSVLPHHLSHSCESLDAHMVQLSAARKASVREASEALHAYKRALMEVLPSDYAQGSAVWECVQSMEKAVSGAGLADLTRLVEGLGSLTADQSQAVIQEYEDLKARLARAELRLRRLVKEQAKEPQGDTKKEEEAWGQLRAFLGLSASSGKATPQEEESFLGRFGSFPPLQHAVSMTRKKTQELRTAVQRATESLLESVTALEKKSDVRLVATKLQTLLDKYEAVQRVADLGAPGGAIRAVDGSGQCAAILTAVVTRAEAFEHEVLPKLSSALLARDSDVREALLAPKRVWNNISRVMLSTEEGAERIARVAEMEKRLTDVEQRLEGLRGVAESPASLAGMQESKSDEQKEQLSQESAWALKGQGLLLSQDGGFEHSQKEGALPESEERGSDAVREASEAYKGLKKEANELKEKLQRDRELEQREEDGPAQWLAAIRALKEDFINGPQSSRLLKGALAELEAIVREAVPMSLSSGTFKSTDSQDGIWGVPESLREEAPFLIQLGLLATIADACLLSAGPNVLAVQVETAGIQALWEALRGLVINQVLPQVEADLKAKIETPGKGGVSENEELTTLVEANVKAPAEKKPLERRQKRIARLEAGTREDKLRMACLDWEHEIVLRTTMPESEWSNRYLQSGIPLRREQVLSALTRAVTTLTRLQEAANTLSPEVQRTEQELDTLVGYVNGHLTALFRQKLAERRQTFWQEEQQGLAMTRLVKLVLEMEAARSVNAPAGVAGLGLEQTGRVWVEGCLRVLTQFHEVVSQHMQVGEALQSARAQQSALLEARSAQLQAVARQREEGAGLQLTLQGLAAPVRQQTPGFAGEVIALVESLKKHLALTKGSEGVLSEILAATEGAVDESATVKAKAEDVLALQKQLNVQVHHFEETLNRLQTLLNPILLTLPNLPAPAFALSPIPPEPGSSLSLWVSVFLTDFLTAVVKADQDTEQLAATVSKTADGVFKGVLEVAETATAHAAGALERAAGGIADEVHGDALAQEEAPTKVVEGLASEATDVSEGRQTALSSSDHRASPKSAQERGSITGSTQPGAAEKAGKKRKQWEEFRTNKHALSVVETIKAKLEGRVSAVIPSAPRSSRLLTVAEQVESLLRQATSIDNLASMYEGWTPWI